MASLLFIAPADLGETVLASGALDYALTPDTQTTLVCGADAADLFRALPGLAATHEIERDAGLSTWSGLALTLGGAHFDRLIDARGSLLARLVRGDDRVTARPSSVLRHRVEEWTDWMGADRALAPRIWLDESARTAAAALAPGDGPLLVLAPGGVEPGKRWPAERFAATARRLVGGSLIGARVALLGAAERDADLTRDIASSLEADGVTSLDLGGIGLLAAAALLERATLCIGNDNVLTHISAALGAPTLTLFGPTDERVRAPYGKRARTLRGRDYEAIMGLSALDGRPQLDDISVDAVEAAAQDLLRAGGLL